MNAPAPETTGAEPPIRTGESTGDRQDFPAAGPGAHPTDGHGSVIGSALPIIRWSSLFLTLLCVALAVAAHRANGLLVLATLFLAVYLWTLRAFRKEFWS